MTNLITTIEHCVCLLIFTLNWKNCGSAEIKTIGCVFKMNTNTYFSVHQVPFPQLVDSKIRTDEFLIAARSLAGLLVKIDEFPFEGIGSNINKYTDIIAATHNEDHAKNEYLEDLALAEKAAGKSEATEAFVWLCRELDFLLVFFEHVVNDANQQEDLSGFVKTAYDTTLEKYAGWFGGVCFSVVTLFKPVDRTSFFKKIALEKENCNEFVVRDMKGFIVQLKECVNHLKEFCASNGLENEQE